MTTSEQASQALVGYTGFVGSTLLRQHPFGACYNSRNIAEITGRSFDLLVCAAPRAEKWIANAQPEEDLAAAMRLVDAIGSARVEQIVLISTVDVFRNPIGPDEATPVDTEGLQPYGLHRHLVEKRLSEMFKTLIVRLPGLYGPGLKKNVIFDFLHDNQTNKIDSRGVFQFYGVDRLWQDIGSALEAGLDVVHLATAPVSVEEVAREAFGMTFVNHVLPAPARYDMRTRHAVLYGGAPPYIESREQVLDGIRRYVEASR